MTIVNSSPPIDLKSLSFALISKGVQVYESETEDAVLGVRLVCRECNEPWYMNMTECFVCGELNHYLYRCSNCDGYASITRARMQCETCGQKNTLKKQCMNPGCLTNENTGLNASINEKGGVFDKGSGFSHSLQYCLKCGSQFHKYQTRRILIHASESRDLKGSDVTLGSFDSQERKTFVVFRIGTEWPYEYFFRAVHDIPSGRIIQSGEQPMKIAEIVESMFSAGFD